MYLSINESIIVSNIVIANYWLVLNLIVIIIKIKIVLIQWIMIQINYKFNWLY